MIEAVARTPVMMNGIGGVNIAAGAIGGKDPVLALRARGDGVSVVMDIAVEDLIVIGIDRDASVRTVLDLKSIHDVVTAIDEKTHVPIRGVESINHRGSRGLRPQNDRA